MWCKCGKHLNSTHLTVTRAAQPLTLPIVVAVHTRALRSLGVHGTAQTRWCAAERERGTKSTKHATTECISPFDPHGVRGHVAFLLVPLAIYNNINLI